jgi:hypothetical protein
MIKIITGFSNGGGSTVAFINLTNELNKYGVACTLYGPHSWHLGYCKSGTLADVELHEDDNMIIHFFDPHWKIRPPFKGNFIYSCHEKDIRPINSFDYSIYDKIHYVSKPQMEWHNVNHPYFILPNIIDKLDHSTCTGKKIAGIIGSIDRNKQVDISIKRAVEDGMNKILLFGNVSDAVYYKEIMSKYGSIILYNGHVDDKQNMYNQITDVYHSSLSETFGLIEKECEMTGVVYHGNEATRNNFDLNMTNEEIIESWKKEFIL